MRTKYGNKKTELDGIKFDSKLEAKRYQELKLLEKAGEISGLRLQVPYVLIPKQRDSTGKAIRETKYIADFVYLDSNNDLVVQDTKGKTTPDYVIKKKLMLSVHGITINEVYAKR